MNNDVVPWDAAVFFSEPGKWEAIRYDGSFSGILPQTYEDGRELLCPHSWQGMRRKKVKRTVGVWLNIYKADARGIYPAYGYHGEGTADANRTRERLGGKAHYVEIEVEE